MLRKLLTKLKKLCLGPAADGGAPQPGDDTHLIEASKRHPHWRRPDDGTTGEQTRSPRKLPPLQVFDDSLS